MGTSHFLLALNDEVIGWLQENDVALPVPLPASRMPTFDELKSVVEALDGYSVKIRDRRKDGCVDIEVVHSGGYRTGWLTTIWASPAGGSTGTVDRGGHLRITFHKGSPELAALISGKIATICGPLVLVDDEGCDPLLITGRINTAER